MRDALEIDLRLPVMDPANYVDAGKYTKWLAPRNTKKCMYLR